MKWLSLSLYLWGVYLFLHYINHVPGIGYIIGIDIICLCWFISKRYYGNAVLFTIVQIIWIFILIGLSVIYASKIVTDLWIPIWHGLKKINSILFTIQHQSQEAGY